MIFKKLISDILNRRRVKKICKFYNLENYVINKDGSIDVNGDVNLAGKLLFNGSTYLYPALTKLPFTFNNVSGNFDISQNRLTSLCGSPKKVTGNFDCSRNKLINLENAPEIIAGDFNCSHNNLRSLKGGPEKVVGFYNVNNNILSTLEYLPIDIREISFKKNKVSSLESLPNIQLVTCLNCDDNPIFNILSLFLSQVQIERNKNRLELFDFCDITRDDVIILDRLKYFFEEIDTHLSNRLLSKLRRDYIIIDD